MTSNAIIVYRSENATSGNVKIALRIITFSNFRESDKPLLKKLQILNVENYLYKNRQTPQPVV